MPPSGRSRPSLARKARIGGGSRNRCQAGATFGKQTAPAGSLLRLVEGVSLVAPGQHLPLSQEAVAARRLVQLAEVIGLRAAGEAADQHAVKSLLGDDGLLDRGGPALHPGGILFLVGGQGGFG